MIKSLYFFCRNFRSRRNVNILGKFGIKIFWEKNKGKIFWEKFEGQKKFSKKLEKKEENSTFKL